MKPAKDHFSLNSEGYSKYRPLFPVECIEEIISLTAERELCWDCATGNGQLALMLSPFFKKVMATDVSKRQLEYAARRPNIEYRLERAEKSSFSDGLFDLITVGQAVHWFDLDHFYSEVNRVLKPGGIIALIGYGRIHGDEVFDRLMDQFYVKEIGSYWDGERRYIESKYKSIWFPFPGIKLKKRYHISVKWGIDEIEGYVQSWSAVMKYRAAKKKDPAQGFLKELSASFSPDHIFELSFPVFYKIGKRVL